MNNQKYIFEYDDFFISQKNHYDGSPFIEFGRIREHGNVVTAVPLAQAKEIARQILNIPDRKKSAKDIEVENNYVIFKQHLKNLINQYGYDKFMLIRHQEFIEVFDTVLDALKAAELLYPDQIYSVQPITDKVDMCYNIG